MNTIAIFLIAIMLLFESHAHSSVLALCIGADGHIELEVAIGGICATDSENPTTLPSDSFELKAQEVDTDHCGSCVDIPIGSGHADTCDSVFTNSKPSLRVPVTQNIQITIHTYESIRTNYFDALSPNPLPTTSIYQRTVSFLI